MGRYKSALAASPTDPAAVPDSRARQPLPRRQWGFHGEPCGSSCILVFLAHISSLDTEEPKLSGPRLLRLLLRIKHSSTYLGARVVSPLVPSPPLARPAPTQLIPRHPAQLPSLTTTSTRRHHQHQPAQTNKDLKLQGHIGASGSNDTRRPTAYAPRLEDCGTWASRPPYRAARNEARLQRRHPSPFKLEWKTAAPLPLPRLPRISPADSCIRQRTYLYIRSICVRECVARLVRSLMLTAAGGFRLVAERDSITTHPRPVAGRRSGIPYLTLRDGSAPRPSVVEGGITTTSCATRGMAIFIKSPTRRSLHSGVELLWRRPPLLPAQVSQPPHSGVLRSPCSGFLKTLPLSFTDSVQSNC